MPSLGEAFPAELARVRELLAVYEEFDDVGFGTAGVRDVLGRAESALASGDVIAMLMSYEEMKGCTG